MQQSFLDWYYSEAGSVSDKVWERIIQRRTESVMEHLSYWLYGYPQHLTYGVEEVVIMKKFIKAVEKAEMRKEDQDTKEIPEELSQILFKYFNRKKEKE